MVVNIADVQTIATNRNILTVFRVCDDAGNVIETYEQAADFKEV